MPKPREEVKEEAYYKDIHFLYEVLFSFKSIDELKLFLKDILTRSELRMLKRRWHIANLLSQGMDLRSVAKKSKTSTATVSRVKHILEEGNGGLKMALARLEIKSNAILRKTIKKASFKGGSKYVKGWFS